jgi:crossover junction endodeoxyribonuclease RusA
MITLILPWPPSLNTLYPSGKNGRRFLSKKGKEYHQEGAAVVLRHLRRDYLYKSNCIGYELTLYPPDKRVRDISNHLKAIEDCMTQCKVWSDDSCVKKLNAELTIWDMDCEYGP